MKHLSRLGQLALLTALATLPAGCSGGGGSSEGRMYILSCVLGCNNGNTGSQVNCGIVNTFENQDVAIQFSSAVDLAHIKANPSTFAVFENSTGIAPPGQILLDPADARRLIFRPLLSFSPLGTPSYGFKPNTSYKIVVPGTNQGDPGPYVKSTSGANNESRMLCTITTDQGVTDPVPGKPVMEIYVEELIPGGGGLTQTTEINDLVGEVSSTSKITFVFRDIMNLGTVVTPITKTAPNITIQVDPDGNLGTPENRTDVGGSYTFDVDQDLLTTTAVFTPSECFVSGGGGARVIVITVPSSVVDLVNNSVANGGLFSFDPESQSFGAVTLPQPSGEMFLDPSNMDVDRTSADWGETQLGRLAQGLGGGSGRLGDLELGISETRTLYTSPQRATGYFDFSFAGNPSKGNQVEIGDGVSSTIFEFKIAPAVPNEVKRQRFVSYSLTELAAVLNASTDPWVAAATYTVEGKKGDRLVITYDTPGSVGNGMTLNVPSGPQTASGPTLAGGIDAMSFGGSGQLGENQIVTNFDFDANPGMFPPPITVDDGVFEFAHVDIAGGATLRIEGDNPARLLTRGTFSLQDQGLIDVSGHDAGPHWSEAPIGQVGPLGGPNGAPGGRGATRPDNTGSDLVNLATGATPYDAGIELPAGVLALLTGGPGFGVGLGGPAVGGGVGGVRWPTLFPPQTFQFGGLETDPDPNCASEQIGGTGSGGAYATDGGLGTAVANNPISLQGGSNTPPDTPGGDASQVGLPPAGTTPLDERTLDPNQGWLRGGSSGGGGGASVSQTQTTYDPTLMVCLDPSGVATTTPIQIYRSHSGAAGGGGGGAIQVQAGRYAQVTGVIVASGGDGGGYDSSLTDPPPVSALPTAPGGGGSGGGILLQSKWLDLSSVPSRLRIDGGAGGLGQFGSAGGAGGTGLVRAESVQQSGSFFQEVAQSITPYDNALSAPEQTNPSNPTAAIHWLSVDDWGPRTEFPEAFNAGQSCWIKASGCFYSLTFESDTDPVNGPFDGWSMDLIMDFGAGEQIFGYRVPASTFFGGMTPQQYWGDLYAEGGNPGAPVVVRFQGIKSTGAITDPCNIDLNAPNAPVDPASITPWVNHPDQLNDYSPAPDMVRFLVLFDSSHPDAGFIKGVTNLRIQADPD